MARLNNPYYQRRQVYSGSVPNIEVPGFYPVDPALIGQFNQQRQQRADVARANQAAAFSALQEQDTADPRDRARKEELMGSLQERYHDIVGQYDGDLARASGAIGNYVSQMRQDPFWKLNEYNLQQRAAYDKLNMNLRAQGLQPLEFKGTQSVYDPETGQYRTKDDLAFDVQEQLDYTNKRAEIVDAALHAEKRGGGMNTDDIMGKSNNAFIQKWYKEGIFRDQTEKKAGALMAQYADTREYEQEMRKLTKLDGLTEEEANETILQDVIKTAQSREYKSSYADQVRNPNFESDAEKRAREPKPYDLPNEPTTTTTLQAVIDNEEEVDVDKAKKIYKEGASALKKADAVSFLYENKGSAVLDYNQILRDEYDLNDAEIAEATMTAERLDDASYKDFKAEGNVLKMDYRAEVDAIDEAYDKTYAEVISENPELKDVISKDMFVDWREGGMFSTPSNEYNDFNLYGQSKMPAGFVEGWARGIKMSPNATPKEKIDKFKQTQEKVLEAYSKFENAYKAKKLGSTSLNFIDVQGNTEVYEFQGGKHKIPLGDITRNVAQNTFQYKFFNENNTPVEQEQLDEFFGGIDEYNKNATNLSFGITGMHTTPDPVTGTYKIRWTNNLQTSKKKNIFPWESNKRTNMIMEIDPSTKGGRDLTVLLSRLQLIKGRHAEYIKLSDPAAVTDILRDIRTIGRNDTYTMEAEEFYPQEGVEPVKSELIVIPTSEGKGATRKYKVKKGDTYYSATESEVINMYAREVAAINRPYLQGLQKRLLDSTQINKPSN